MRVFMAGCLVCLVCGAGLGQEKVKYLDLKALKVGDVGKLPPCVNNDKEIIEYKVFEIKGATAVTVKQWRYYPNKTGTGTLKEASQAFGIYGYPTATLKPGQIIAVDFFVWEVVADVALNPGRPFNKIKILQVK